MQETQFYRLQIYVKKKTFSRLSQKMFSKVDCGVVCPAVSRLLCKVAVIHTQKPAAGVGVCGVCWGYLCGGGGISVFCILFDFVYNIGAYLFFGISALIILFVLRQTMILYKNPIFISVLEQIGEIKGGKEDEAEKGETKLIEKENIDLREIGEEKKEEKESKEDKGLIFLIMKILDINIMVILCYTISIGLFPGACIRPSLFGLSPGWKINTIIFLYNLFDTIGRKLVGYIKKPTKCHLITTIALRFIFLCSFPFVIYLEKYNKLSSGLIGVLSVLNTSLMALTNGIANNLCFSLAPEQVEGELKAKAGSSVSLCLSVGLFIGSFLANVMDKINNNL